MPAASTAVKATDRYSDALKKIAATKTADGTMNAIKNSIQVVDRMDEVKQVAEDFKRAYEQDVGRPLTEKEKKTLEDFAESFLLLLDDTEE